MLYQTTLMILVFTLLTGCSYTLTQYTDAPISAKAVAIELELVNAQLELVALTQSLGVQQQSQLYKFITLQGNSYPQRVKVAGSKQLITRHQTQLRQWLLMFGIQATNIAFSDNNQSNNRLIITSEYFRTIAPACHNGSHADLGCASSRNLAMMIADPVQLIRGASLVPMDGVKATEAVKRYRYPTEPQKSETLVDLTKVK
jgi:pilus biogenesis lipoprotein CpaD